MSGYPRLMSSLSPDDPARPLSAEDLANQAEVPLKFVVGLVELGALEGKGDDRYSRSDVGRVAMLHAWQEAGLSTEDIMGLVKARELSISWLDAPVMTSVARLDVTFEQLCSEAEVPQTTISSLYEALGFAPPGPTDSLRAGDRELVGLLQAFFAAGAEEGPTLRLLRVYADSLRRIAKAEAELFESRDRGAPSAPRGEQKAS